MVLNLLTKVFGSKNERELKRIQPLVDKINTLEPEIQALARSRCGESDPTRGTSLTVGRFRWELFGIPHKVFP